VEEQDGVQALLAGALHVLGERRRRRRATEQVI